MKIPTLFLFLATSLTMAADVVFMEDGTRRSGNVLPDKSPTSLILEITLPPPANRPDLPPATSRVSIPLDKIRHIEFGREENLEKAIQSANLPLLEATWEKWRAWLKIPRSPAPQVALALAEARLKAGNPTAAFSLFQQVEAEAWDLAARELARPGRLRALIAQGRAEEAVAEAAELAKISEDPAVLIEANHIRAQAAEASLRKLLEDNPRWQEDIFVIPERDRLYHLALDLYLSPALFHGEQSAAAARGLWGAIGILKLAGDLEPARELARDILSLYPSQPEARLASEFLAQLPEDVRSADPEKEAREELSEKPTTKS